jgi:hypothetical protein
MERWRMKLALILVTCIAALVVAAGALGAPNPNGTGQPSQSCQVVGTGPPGITSTTNGFSIRAVNVYAGSPGTESAEANAHAVSQYDVACYQFAQSH